MACMRTRRDGFCADQSNGCASHSVRAPRHDDRAQAVPHVGRCSYAGARAGRAVEGLPRVGLKGDGVQAAGR